MHATPDAQPGRGAAVTDLPHDVRQLRAGQRSPPSGASNLGCRGLLIGSAPARRRPGDGPAVVVLRVLVRGLVSDAPALGRVGVLERPRDLVADLLRAAEAEAFVRDAVALAL